MKITEAQAAALRRLRDVPFLWDYQIPGDNLDIHELAAGNLIEYVPISAQSNGAFRGFRITMAGIRAMEEHDNG